MKKIALLIALSIALGACSAKPGENEIRKLFIDSFMQSDGLVDILAIDNFIKTNGFEKDEKTYVADVAYDIVFKRNRSVMKSVAKTPNVTDMTNDALLMLRFGDFKAGDKKHEAAKITLIKTEGGWRIESVNY